MKLVISFSVGGGVHPKRDEKKGMHKEAVQSSLKRDAVALRNGSHELVAHIGEHDQDLFMKACHAEIIKKPRKPFGEGKF